MNFHNLEDNRVCKMKGHTNLYKRYADRFYWLSDIGWSEIRPNYDYNAFEYLDEVLKLPHKIIT